MGNSENHKKRKTRVFISYSRKDRAHLDRLIASFKSRDIDIFRDLDDILPTEDWWDRIKQLIGRSDTFVFLVSPNSLQSRVCLQELAFAESLQKRAAPVVISKVEAALIPSSLSKLNYIFLDEDEASYDKAFDHLVTAVTVEIGWVREHTRLGELARRWEKSERPSSLLLRGREINKGEEWIKNAPPDTPPPTQLHGKFIKQSRKASRTRKSLLYLGGTSAITASLVGSAVLMIAQEERYIATINELALTAHATIAKGDPLTGTLLGLEAVPSGPFSYLRKTQAQGERATYAGLHAGPDRVAPFWHNDSLTNAQLSPDHKLIASSSKDGTIRLWNVENKRQMAILTGHFSEVSLVKFSPDGKTLLSASTDRTARLWDIPSGKMRVILQGHKDAVTHASFDKSGKRVITSSKKGGAARIWSTQNGAQITVLKAGIKLLQPREIQVANFTPDDKSVLMVEHFARTTSARLFDPTTGKLKQHLVDFVTNKQKDCFNDGRVKGAAKCYASNIGPELKYSPDGRRVIVFESSPGKFWLADTFTGAKIANLRQARTSRGEQRLSSLDHPNTSFAVFSQNSLKFATNSKHGPTENPLEIMRIWDAKSGQKICGIQLDKGRLFSHFFSADGEYLIGTHGPRGNLKTSLWNTNNCQRLSQFKSNRFELDFPYMLGRPELTLSRDATRLVRWKRRSVQLWDVYKGEFIKSVGKNNQLRNVFLSPNGRLILSKGRNGNLHLWDSLSGAEKGFLTSHKNSQIQPLFNWDGSRLLTFDKTDAILWDMQSAKKIADLPGGGEIIDYPFFARHGGQIMIPYEKRKLGRIWSAKEGSPILLDEDGNASTWSTLNAPDGKTDAKGVKGGTVIYDARTGKDLFKISGLLTYGSILSRDNSTFLTMGLNHDAWLYDYRNGALIGQLSGHKEHVSRTQMSFDGSRVMTGGISDPVLRLWDGRTARLIRRLKGHKRGILQSAVSPDGKRIATGARDVIVWDTENGNKIALLPSVTRDSSSDISGLYFGSDIPVLLSWDKRKSSGALWKIFPTTKALVEHARARVPRCLSITERKTFGLSASPPQWCVDQKKWPFHQQVSPPPQGLKEATRKARNWITAHFGKFRQRLKDRNQ